MGERTDATLDGTYFEAIIENEDMHYSMGYLVAWSLLLAHV